MSDSKNNKLIIHVYTVCWNEDKFIPYFLRHYSQFADKIIVYDNGSTDNSIKLFSECPVATVIPFDSSNVLDEFKLTQVRNECFKASRGVADFVIVVDIDELLYHPNMQELLLSYKKDHIVFPKVIGYDMIHRRFPRANKQIYDVVKNGIVDAIDIPGYFHLYSKRCVFNPEIDLVLSPGSHFYELKSPVKESDNADLKLFHFKHLGIKYVKDRYDQYQSRGLSDRTKKAEMAVQYSLSLTNLKRIQRSMNENSVNVFMPGNKLDYLLIKNDYNGILNYYSELIQKEKRQYSFYEFRHIFTIICKLTILSFRKYKIESISYLIRTCLALPPLVIKYCTHAGKRFPEVADVNEQNAS